MAARNITRSAALACKYSSPLKAVSHTTSLKEEGKMSKVGRNRKRKSSTGKAKSSGGVEKQSRASVGELISDPPESSWFPDNWEMTLDFIRQMRKEVEAPVDQMGCDMCHDKSSPPAIQRFQILVSLMLSSQTKDQVTFAAMGRLRSFGLTPENILSINDVVLAELIKPVGFHKRKAIYIKQVSQILLDKYDGDIPNTLEDLCKLPGVGPKMAHICMKSAWNQVTGIGVDTHVHRISQRIGWLPPAFKIKKKLTPEDTRAALQSWLPRSYWAEVNHLLVGFGQTICKPISPKCKGCLNNQICPSAELQW